MIGSQIASRISLPACGRLSSMKSVAQKILKTMKENDEVEAAAITFGTNAYLVSDFLPLPEFVKVLSADTVCKAVDSTDYAEAFNLGSQILKAQAAKDAQTVPVTTYFISDGLPSVGDNPTDDDIARFKNEAVVAAGEFRLQSDLNAIFLEPRQDIDGEKPSDYLTMITGDQGKVALATNAAGLAAAITQFKIPAAAPVNSTASASLTAGGQSQVIPVDKIDMAGDDNTTITVTTENFSFKGETGVAKNNVLKLSIKLGEGTIREANVIVHYSLVD